MLGGLPGDPHLKALPPSLPASSGSFTPAAGGREKPAKLVAFCALDNKATLQLILPSHSDLGA